MTYADRLRATELDDTICDCGAPLEGHPPLPAPKPWERGRPCNRRARGQMASGSSFLERRPRGRPRNGT